MGWKKECSFLSNLPSRKPGRESALISPSTMDSTHSATNPIGKYHIGFTAQMVRLSIARVERIAHREQAVAPSTYGISR
ncbi:MAG: hypothetical protein E6I61_10160 [Chloroflexi bacterium]|nr:MAG: hypothetical protein E6J08_06335 [Chloroflexota bacterium]TME04041.1 MAG: hypothetical protein E6I71_08050 [Chloroflexota bacterium]TME40115.1 MAG: hypothetical protein E6I61_10160 [Chloroflexota bacterium]TME50686.1 MAG: hypothetical protein E6I53_12630 [Chloroflexota bacterium]